MSRLQETNDELDIRVRLAAFQWLGEQIALLGDVLPVQLLREGFPYEGAQVRLVGPQGIFKPRILPELPLSITTAPGGPYDDHFTSDGLIAYRYRGFDPDHRDNVGLREAGRRQTPLVYFAGVATGKYLVACPVFVVGDDRRNLTFTIAVDAAETAEEALRRPPGGLEVREAEGRRAYITATVRVRLHQRGFRERVLRAYREQCALCRLRHRDLLDAAHIVPDGDPAGDPSVSNGLALCKIHHAAFDHRLFGIRPDYVVEVHPKVLAEVDGPMLRHGLQQIHDTTILLPSSRRDYPDPERLQDRYERFRGAA